MNLPLILAFLFFIGSLVGWGIEVIFRRFVSNRKTHKWVNPGFLVGPYLPLYGFGLCLLYLLSKIDVSFIESPWLANLVRFVAMSLSMTVIEYIAGLIFIKGMNIKLWDYSDQPGNVGGIICPLFSFFWGILGMLYFHLVHPYITDAVMWLSHHLVFSFFIGFFFGILTIDLYYSLGIAAKIRKFAQDNEIVVKYEALKQHIAKLRAEQKEKTKFIFAFRSDTPLSDILKKYLEREPKLLKKRKKKSGKK